MALKTAYRVLYNRRKHTDKNGVAPVEIEAYRQGKRKYLPTGIRVEPKDWDDKKKMVKGNATYNSMIRNRVNELETFALCFLAIYGRPFVLNDLKLVDAPDIRPSATALSFTKFITEQLVIEKHRG